MGSLFTSLLNSTNSLQVYGRVFSVIENNIANANTPGYARQDQSLVSMPFHPAEGVEGGVMAGPLISARPRGPEEGVRNQPELLGAAPQKAAEPAPVETRVTTAGKAGDPGAR